MKIKSKNLMLLFFFFLSLFGCSTIKEAAYGIAGLSTKVLEDGRKDGIRKTFNYDYKTCYNKIRGALIETGSYIYAEDSKKQMLAIYVSETDTTAVGIFFKEIDKVNTQIEVSSPSTYAKELIANMLFSALESPVNPKEKKGYPDDAKKEMGDK